LKASRNSAWNWPKERSYQSSLYPSAFFLLILQGGKAAVSLQFRTKRSIHPMCLMHLIPVPAGKRAVRLKRLTVDRWLLD